MADHFEISTRKTTMSREHLIFFRSPISPHKKYTRVFYPTKHSCIFFATPRSKVIGWTNPSYGKWLGGPPLTLHPTVPVEFRIGRFWGKLKHHSSDRQFQVPAPKRTAIVPGRPRKWWRNQLGRNPSNFLKSVKKIRGNGIFPLLI